MPGAKRKHMTRFERWTEKLPFLGMSYPVKALIVKDFGDSYSVEWDRAARVRKEDGSEAYVLKNNDDEMPSIDYDCIYQAANGENIVVLHCPESGIYNPQRIEFDDGEVNFSAEDANWNQWQRLASMEERKKWDAEEGWWSKNRDVVILVSAGFFFMLTGVGIWFALKDMAGALQAATSTMNSVADTLAGAATGGG